MATRQNHEDCICFEGADHDQGVHVEMIDTGIVFSKAKDGSAGHWHISCDKRDAAYFVQGCIAGNPY